MLPPTLTTVTRLLLSIARKEILMSTLTTDFLLCVPCSNGNKLDWRDIICIWYVHLHVACYIGQRACSRFRIYYRLFHFIAPTGLNFDMTPSVTIASS